MGGGALGLTDSLSAGGKPAVLLYCNAEGEYLCLQRFYFPQKYAIIKKNGGIVMSKKTGERIKQARLNADLTQEKLAQKLGGGITASDISKAERGEAELTTETIKKIAKITGVTQVSLLGTSKTAAKKTAGTTKTAVKKTASSAAKTGTMKLTAAEKKLVEAYRKADSDKKKQALRLLTAMMTATSCPPSAAAS